MIRTFNNNTSTTNNNNSTNNYNNNNDNHFSKYQYCSSCGPCNYYHSLIATNPFHEPGSRGTEVGNTSGAKM